MRIGVICEGPTDFHAIQIFFGHLLENAGKEIEFIPLQPQMDSTAPGDGGWGNVLLWLDKNPPSSRLQKYFGGGLFGGSLSFQPLDALLIHLDSDILDNESFSDYVLKNYHIRVSSPTTAIERATVIRSVLSVSAKFLEMTELDVKRHIFAPAVESTENWCVAAFNKRTRDFESLSGEELANEFMSALETSEGTNPNQSYANINKSPKRRKRFCQTHANCSNRILDGCSQFNEAYKQILSLPSA